MVYNSINKLSVSPISIINENFTIAAIFKGQLISIKGRGESKNHMDKMRRVVGGPKIFMSNNDHLVVERQKWSKMFYRCLKQHRKSRLKQQRKSLTSLLQEDWVPSNYILTLEWSRKLYEGTQPGNSKQFTFFTQISIWY